MPEAVIVAAARTPIGRAFKGSLADVRADDLSGFITRTALDQVPAVPDADVVDVIWGAANMVGPQGFNMARNIALLAGLPDSVPGTTVTRFCASSLQAIRMAFHAIKAGEGDTYVAGGVESVTMTAGKLTTPEDKNPRFTDTERSDYLADAYIAMGLTAENVARQYSISRQRQDEYAVLSQNRAEKAIANGFFEREITPYTKADGTVVARDDSPRAGTTIEAVRKVLAQAGMAIGDIDVVELNEAFAAQVLPVCDATGIDIERQLNPHGGGIALGHPFGMTGARIATTLIHALQDEDKTFGLETMCVGGGQGMAIIFERLS